MITLIKDTLLAFLSAVFPNDDYNGHTIDCFPDTLLINHDRALIAKERKRYNNERAMHLHVGTTRPMRSMARMTHFNSQMANAAQAADALQRVCTR